MAVVAVGPVQRYGLRDASATLAFLVHETLATLVAGLGVDLAVQVAAQVSSLNAEVPCALIASRFATLVADPVLVLAVVVRGSSLISEVPSIVFSEVTATEAAALRAMAVLVLAYVYLEVLAVVSALLRLGALGLQGCATGLGDDALGVSVFERRLGAVAQVTQFPFVRFRGCPTAAHGARVLGLVRVLRLIHKCPCLRNSSIRL